MFENFSFQNSDQHLAFPVHIHRKFFGIGIQVKLKFQVMYRNLSTYQSFLKFFETIIWLDNVLILLFDG